VCTCKHMMYGLIKSVGHGSWGLQQLQDNAAGHWGTKHGASNKLMTALLSVTKRPTEQLGNTDSTFCRPFRWSDGHQSRPAVARALQAYNLPASKPSNGRQHYCKQFRTT
jgi:hypothetical protein